LGKAVAAGAVDPKDAILLNITGGGISHLKEERDQNVLERDLAAEPADLVSDRDLLDKINEVQRRQEA
ncbi:MAG: cysteate synthase, partial [Euryarchaeota archaeon]|nr:cysteate synthase [Euryarchaeota archaeon]